jgi:hypothetical protein
MGWVKVYEYDLGFYILETLAQVDPNEKNYNEKHTMGAYKNAKENTFIETLTFERAIKKLAYLNLFTHFEGNVNKELVKGERW